MQTLGLPPGSTIATRYLVTSHASQTLLAATIST